MADVSSIEVLSTFRIILLDLHFFSYSVYWEGPYSIVKLIGSTQYYITDESL